MKTLTEKQSFFTRLANGDRKTQLAVFGALFIIGMVAFVLWGHSFKYGL